MKSSNSSSEAAARREALLKLGLPISLNDLTRGPWRKLLIGMNYVFRRRGVLSFGASLAGGFGRTPLASDRPDVQFHFQPLSLDSYDGGLHPFIETFSRLVGLQLDIDVRRPLPGKMGYRLGRTYAVHAVTLRTRCRGHAFAFRDFDRSRIC